MILTSDNKYISFRNILNQHEFLGALVDSIKDSDYVDLINRLFESSDRTKKTGIYNFIDSFLINPNVQSASSSNKLGFAFDGANIFTVIDKTQSLILHYLNQYSVIWFNKLKIIIIILII
ncbi:hypothetical protein [Mycoplasmopsis cynos]|nr:hypothetical protein [Mycoplasmopsis cynos]UWV81722.1 hypothetical protein NW065_00970 [Mycoplasmopsis cynos]